MYGRRNESGANVGGITRGLKKSVITDENEVQRKQTVKDVRPVVEAKQAVPFKRQANNSKGLFERSMNVTTRSLGLAKPIFNDSKASVKTVKAAHFGGGNMLVSVDCAEDIHQYLRFLEDKCLVPENFLHASSQGGGVDGRMRQILVDWLVHVQRRFNLLNETLSLAVFLLDRALLQMNSQINKNNLQMLGVSCMFLAAKFEEIVVPNIQDFVYVAADVFTKKDVLRMEQTVLKSVGFACSITHSIQFLRRYRFYLSAPKQVHILAKFISEIALVIYSLSHHKPSTVAAVSLYMSAFVHKFQIPASVFSEVMMMEEKAVAEIARSFVPSVLQIASPNAKLYALRDKYQKDLSLPFKEDQIKRLQKFAAEQK